MQHKLINVFLIGPLGAGKSTIGKKLAKALGFYFYDTDEEIIKRSGVEINWIFDVEGESGYRKREAQVILDLAHKKQIVLATGGGAVLLKQNRKILGSHGTVVYLRTHLTRQLERLKKDKKRPLIQDKTDLGATLSRLQKQRLPYYESLSDITVDSDKDSIANIVKAILEKLGQDNG